MSGDDDNVISLDDYRPCGPEERLQAIVELAHSGLGRGDGPALEVLYAMATVLRDVERPTWWGDEEAEP